MPSGAWREGPFLSLSRPFQRPVLLSLARGPVLRLQSQQPSTSAPSLPGAHAACPSESRPLLPPSCEDTATVPIVQGDAPSQDP